MAENQRERETRIVPTLVGKKWRFVKANDGVEYCVEQLFFKSGKLKELDCYRVDEFGTKFTVHLRPGEIKDMSEIAELLTQAL